MNLFPSIQKLLAEQGFARSASRHQRLHLLELLETRCVLSGFGMPPMMGEHGDFAFGGGDWGRPEEHGPGPDFGRGMDGGQEIRGPRGGEFGPPRQPEGQPPAPFDGFLVAPEQGLLPPPGDLSYGSFPPLMIIVVVTRLPASAPAEAAPPPAFSALDGPSRVPELNPNSTASSREPPMASIAVVGDPSLSRSTSSVSSLATTPETNPHSAFQDHALRDGDTAQKRSNKESPAGQVKSNQADGLLELATVENSQRLKRKVEKVAADQEPSSDKEPERLGTMLSSLTKVIPVPRSPLPAEAHDIVLSVWSPEDAGLMEILAADTAGSAGRRSVDAQPASSALRTTSGLQAEVGLYQAFDLATEPTSDSPLISTTASPLVSAPPPQPAPGEKTE